MNTTHRILKWVLVASIVIVLNLFFNFAVKLVYDSPQWDEFCPREQVTVQPKTQEECVSKGGAWTEHGYPLYPRGEAAPLPAKPVPLTPDAEITGSCDPYYTCQKEFDTAREVINRNIFIVLVALGALSIVAGFVFSAVSAVSLGLSFGGVLSLIIGTIRYWSDMDDYLRVIVLGVALAVLLYLGYKKIRE